MTWIIHIYSAASVDQMGGYNCPLVVDVSGIQGYTGHGLVPTVYTQNLPFYATIPSFSFQYDCNVKHIGHYVDMTQEPWASLFTENKTVTGPGFAELVLGQWKVISFTVGNNLSGAEY